MGKIVACSIIIYDDFNNILISERSNSKKAEKNQWSTFGKELKGKETEEKCITKAVDKDIKCTVFDLTPFKEYVINDVTGDTLLMFTGRIKERVTAHKDINEVKWVSFKEIDNYNFLENEKDRILDFFSSIKK